QVINEVQPHLMAQILTRVTETKSGDTVTIAYRTAAGLVPVIDVYNQGNVLKVAKKTMTEKKKDVDVTTASSVYEYELTFEKGWGIGEFAIICSESTLGTVDALNITVVRQDIADVAGNVAAVLGVTSGLGNVEGVVGGVSSQMTVLRAALNKISQEISSTVAEAQIGAASIESVHSTLAQLGAKMQEMSSIKDLGLEKLYEVEAGKKEDMNYIKNKTQELKALMELNQKMMDNVANEPITQLWYEYGSIILKAILVNPSATQVRDVPFKAYLPKEAKPENILNKRELNVAYDTQQGSYYVFAMFKLKPQEVKELEIEMEDIWQVNALQIDSTRGEARKLATMLKSTEFSDRSGYLLKDIEDKLYRIVKSQDNVPANPEVHISQYRDNVKLMEEADLSLVLLRSLTGQMKVNPFQMTWKLIVAIIVFLGLLSLGFYIVWQKQIKLGEVPTFEIEEETEETKEEGE
ncbi:MAG: hypothetical protein ABH844_03770, partial [Candidatus Omnitrophota bacterium]